MSFAPENQALAKPESLLRAPVGMTSPLWGLFAGAAISGAAWWWMTRWTRPQNLEAMFAPVETVEIPVEPALAAIPAPVAEAVEIVQAVEPIVEAAIEAAPEPVAEPFAEAVIEIVAESKSKKKAAPTKAD